MTATTTEVSIRGVWVRVPAVDFNGLKIVSTGKWAKMASICDEEWLDVDLTEPVDCMRRLKQTKGFSADILTYAQQLPFKEAKFSYHMEWDNIAALEIPSFEQWWESLPQEGRKNVRRAEKRGVVTSVKPLDDDLIRDIMGVNNDSPVRQGIPYVHYGKSFEQVKRDQTEFLDRSEYVCAYVEQELIGFTKIVYRGASASIIQFLPKASHSDKRPANALIAAAVKRCAEKGVSWLIYGKFNYWNNQDSSLKEFKSRNGFQELLMPRYYVPLTLWGRMCMAVGAHHGLHGVLPPKVMALLVRARAKYYEVRQPSRRRSLIAEQPNSNRQTECANPPAGSNLNEV